MLEFHANTLYENAPGQWFIAILIVFGLVVISWIFYWILTCIVLRFTEKPKNVTGDKHLPIVHKRLKTGIAFRIFIGLFFLLPLKSFPINNDSLWNVWNDDNQPDSTRLKAINRILYLGYYQTSISIDSLLMLSQNMYDLAVNAGLKKPQSNALGYLGLNYGKRYNYQKALEYYEQRITLCAEINYIRGIAQTYEKMGYIHKNESRLIESITYFKKSLEKYNEIPDSIRMAYCLNSIGTSYSQLTDYTTARSYYDSSIAMIDTLDEYFLFQAVKSNIASILADQGDYKKALPIIIDHLKYLKTTTYDMGVGISNEHLGGIYVNQGKYNLAHEAYQKSLKIYLQKNDKLGIAWLYGSIGDAYKKQGNFIKALEYLKRSRNGYTEVNYRVGIAYCLISFGEIYIDLENYDISLDYLQTGYELFEEIGTNRGIAVVYSLMGEIYHKLADYSQSYKYYEMSLSIFMELEIKSEIAVVYNKLGIHFKELGDYINAKEYLMKSKEIYEEIEHKKGIAEVYIDLGDLNLIQNNVNDGILWCKKAYDIANEIGVLKLEQEASFCLYKAYKELGKSTLALNYYENYLALQDSLKTDEASKQLQQMEFERQHLADSLAAAEDKLETKLAHQETLLKEKNTRNTFMFVGLGILLIAGVLFSRMMFIRKTNKKLEEKNKAIEKEKEKAEESEKAKEQFFDNVSHEFRTPLTLILGPLEEVMESTKDENKKAGLQIVQRNALRLQGMINEILELSKLEFGKVKLQAKEENIVELTKQYLQSFESLAEQKKIKLSFKSESSEYKIWVDTEKYRKILTNLLSNAFKFTEGGEIKVRITPLNPPKGGRNPRTPPFPKGAGGIQPTWIEISISDTGIGIPKDKLTHVFDRFYQVGEPTQSHHAGTGIGLALTKELVELHHGTISVESEPGKGTSFIIYFPLGNEHLQEDEIASEGVEPENTTTETEHLVIEKEIPGFVIEEEIKKKKDLPVLLITEDNPDMRSYIKTHLKNEYNIIEAENGEEGLRKAIEQIPDLIISDVMMPKMDGYEMTEKIKTDLRTSHIPVIMLTARASVESRIEGLETGADAYVTKPFNARELKVRVKKLIEQRQKLREKFGKNLNSGIRILENSKLSSMDRKFIEKAIEVVTDHLSDTDFDAPGFASGMALSRAQLHRKIKALSNKTTTEFIRTIRLNRAAELLKHKTDSVTQIAYATGFSSLSWFSRMFREQFGVSPSDYMN